MSETEIPGKSRNLSEKLKIGLTVIRNELESKRTYTLSSLMLRYLRDGHGYFPVYLKIALIDFIKCMMLETKNWIRGLF